MNVRSLKLISDQIADLYELENWIGITLTETWLYQGILEAEIDTRISHSIDVIETPGCIGVVVIYQRENILCKKVSNFSNSVVGNLIMKYKKLEKIFVSIYRPLDARNNEWDEALSELRKLIEMTQSNRVYETVIVTGDFNFQNLTWDQRMIQIDQSFNHQEEKFSYSWIDFVDSTLLTNLQGKEIFLTWFCQITSPYSQTWSM